MARFVFFPDLVLILVVYTGIFYGLVDTLLVGLVAGLLRGLLSYDTLQTDMIVFPMIGALSLYIGGLFNRSNPLVGALISFVSVILAVIAHVLWERWSYGADIGIIAILAGNWRVVVSTAAVFPFLYFLLNSFLSDGPSPGRDRGRIYY